MDRFVYRDILREMMVSHADNKMNLLWTFQKYASKLVKQWSGTNHIEVKKWPAQSPELYPIENL